MRVLVLLILSTGVLAQGDGVAELARIFQRHGVMKG